MPHITFAPGQVDDITEYIEYIMSLDDPRHTRTGSCRRHKLVDCRAIARFEMAQRRAIEKVPRLDWAGRCAVEIMPLTFRSE